MYSWVRGTLKYHPEATSQVRFALGFGFGKRRVNLGKIERSLSRIKRPEVCPWGGGEGPCLESTCCFTRLMDSIKRAFSSCANVSGVLCNTCFKINLVILNSTPNDDLLDFLMMAIRDMPSHNLVKTIRLQSPSRV